MRLIFLAITGSALINAATLVSSPMAIKVIYPGIAVELATQKIHRAFLQDLRAHEANRPGGLLDALLRSRNNGHNRYLAPFPPASQRNLAAKRARAAVSPETVVTPSNSSSGLFMMSARAKASSISVPMSVSRMTGNLAAELSHTGNASRQKNYGQYC